jgi:hypothetical protein
MENKTRSEMKLNQKPIQIKVPNRMKDCRIQQIWDASNYLLDKDELDIQQRIKLVSLFSGVTETKLRQVDLLQLNKVFIHIMQLLSEKPTGEPPQVITLNGKRYTFRNRMTAGQFIDYEVSGTKSPAMLAAIVYVEEGMAYAEVDDRTGEILNPLTDRAEVMAAHMTGDVFMQLCAFFLNLSEMLQRAFLAQKQQELATLKKKVNRLHRLR